MNKSTYHLRTTILMAALISLLPLALTILTLPPAKAQQDKHRQLVQRGEESQISSRRLALVIGNAAYSNAPALKNPASDATDMAKSLSQLGFTVEQGINLTQKQMKFMIRQFGQSLRAGGQGLFFFSGHGVQLRGRNYLIPVDADIQSEADVEDQGVDVSLVLGLMDEAGNGLNVVILDACRNNPFVRSFRSASNGLAQVDAPTGTLIAYATAPGRVARDGSGHNGTYTAELLKQMNVPGLGIEELMKRVRANVKQETNGEQVPWELSSLVGDFYLNRTNTAGTTIPSVASIASVTLPFGAALPDSAFRSFAFDTVTLDKSGREVARRRGEARSYIEKLGEVMLEMVEIPAGVSFMGSSKEDIQTLREILGPYYDSIFKAEQPQHRVTIPTFFIGKFEITQQQWRAVAALPKIRKNIKPNPSTFKGDYLPVDSVTWEDAFEFCARLSRKTGREYRLPSEAEWEYAERAGASTLYSWGETIATRMANYSNDSSTTSEVGKANVANGFGLYDIQGNVSEWCQDVWHDNYEGAPVNGGAWILGGDQTRRVLRGCAWSYANFMCRSAIRYSASSNDSIFNEQLGALNFAHAKSASHPDGAPGPEDYGFRIAISARIKTSVP